MDRHPDWWVGSTLNAIPEMGDKWRKLYEEFIPRVPKGSRSAVEIGCFPGGFITEIGKQGYRISGFDTHAEVHSLNKLFETTPSIERGAFYCESLDKHMERGVTYDLVISMGFIEHFEDWPSVFKKHYDLCSAGGKIIIGAPNFATPVQRALHTTLDLANINNHCLHSMYPLAWEGYMRALGLSVVYGGHYAGFDFWTETNPVDAKSALLSSLTKALVPHLNGLSQHFNAKEAGYSIIVADKGNESYDRSDLDAFSEYFLRLSRHLSSVDATKALEYIDTFESLLT